MTVVRLSGHSGAGKSRLLAALAGGPFELRRSVLYTSRSPRVGEIDGEDYHFRSLESIERLPRDRFLVGHVREMLQAVDLEEMEQFLRSSGLVVVEVFHGLWPDLKAAMGRRLGTRLLTASVFLTAVQPSTLMDLCRDKAAQVIREEVECILRWRNRNSQHEVLRRSDSAVEEILNAINGVETYDRIVWSAPEGPDGQDDWTRCESPVGQAANAVKEFLSFVNDVQPPSG